MKKIYENITEINIIGKPEVLGESIQDINTTIKNLGYATLNIETTMRQYSKTNQGVQYQNACRAVSLLSHQLCEAVNNLNNLQLQIVKYVNKVLGYEVNHGFWEPTIYRNNLKKVEVKNDTSKIEFHKDEMVEVIRRLDDYVNNAITQNKKMLSNKCDIGRIWKDPQYQIFSDFIDEITSFIYKGCQELYQYSFELKEKIKRLA